MFKILLGRGLAAFLLALVGTNSTMAASSFPAKPVRIVVPASPGGALDITTRLVAQKMSENLGQPIIVDNRAGGDTLLGTRMVKDAPADGYTILATANGHSIMSALKLDPGFDPLKDFTAIGLMVRSPVLIEVGTDQPDKTLGEFVTRAKAHPNQLTYGSSGVGGPPHIAAALFLRAAGMEMTHVPYKGNGAALPDVAGGRLSMIFDAYISSAPYLRGGKLRPLGVTGSKRLAILPDVPTIAEQGVDYTYSLWLGLVAPAGTPKEVIQRLSDALHYATSNKELTERFQSEGSEPMHDSPEELNAYLSKEVPEMIAAVSELKIPKQ